MKKLNVGKIVTVDSAVAIDKYQGELLKALHQNILLSAQNEKMQEIIQTVFKKAPDAFPTEFVIEKKEEK